MKKRIAVIACLVMLLALALTGCSKEFTVDVSALNHINLNGALSGTVGTEYTVTLTADEHHDLPQAVIVTVAGTVLEDGYTYDSTTGVLTITGDAVTGDIVITAEAPESLVGDWEGSIDVSDMMNQAMGVTPETAEYFSFSDLSLGMAMTFTRDGVYTLSISDTSVEALIADVLEQMKPGIEKLLEAALAEAEVDMTVEEYLSSSGTDLDTLLEEAFDEAIAEGLVNSMSSAGRYVVEDSLLYLSDNMTTEIDEENNNAFEITDGVLTIQEGPTDEDVSFMFPLVLKRVP